MSRNRTLHRNRWLYLSSYNLIADPPVFGACRELDGRIVAQEPNRPDSAPIRILV
jgi:hypothetical protein